jgi:hypothetical protein
MLLVIFGAGASFDSVHHLPPDDYSIKPITSDLRSRHGHNADRPPLAFQLFEDRPTFVALMKEFPDCLPVIPLLRGKVAVEQQLAVLEQQAKKDPTRHRQLLAIRFYLHRMLLMCQQSWAGHHWGITNYATFLDAIRRWCEEFNETVCFVTFNYDTILEQAMDQVLGTKLYNRTPGQNLGGYVSNPKYKLIKLHGSIDWGLVVSFPERPSSPQELLEHAAELQISDRFMKADPNIHFGNGIYGLPALAIPVEKKSEFVCPEAHRQVLVASLRSVTKVIAIGWRASEQNFLDMLHNRLTGLPPDVDLMVVSGDQEGMIETTNNLAIISASTTCKRALRNNGFTGLISEIGHLESFLR